MARSEWEHWSTVDDPTYAPVIADSVQPIVDRELHELVDVDHRICDEVHLVPTPGHTPGHVSVMIESNGERALITGDSFHHPVQMVRPIGVRRLTRIRLGASRSDGSCSTGCPGSMPMCSSSEPTSPARLRATFDGHRMARTGSTSTSGRRPLPPVSGPAAGT